MYSSSRANRKFERMFPNATKPGDRIVTQNIQQTDCYVQLPPVSEIEQALNLAQAEIRAMYKRLDIKGSNVLDLVDKTLEAVQAAIVT